MQADVWERIAPKDRSRKTAVVIVVVLALVALAAVVLSRTGVSTSTLSLEPVRVERGNGVVRLHVRVHNEGRVKAVVASVSDGTTLPVESIEPHRPPDVEEDPSVEVHYEGGRQAYEKSFRRVLPGYGWEIGPGQARDLTLVVKVACGTPLPGNRVEMVAYAPAGGHEVHLPWRGGLADWQERVDQAACA